MTTWNIVDTSFPIATYEYSFGPGLANSLAVGIDGGIAIVSPPCRVVDGRVPRPGDHARRSAAVVAIGDLSVAPARFSPCNRLPEIARKKVARKYAARTVRWRHGHATQ